jgi:hypothetical protein
MRVSTRFAVDRDPERLAVDEHRCPRAHARERLPASAMTLAPVHEPRVDAERDVVQEQAIVGASDIDALLAAAEGV